MTNVAIIGFGNIGKAAYEAVAKQSDLSLKAIVSKQKINLGVPVIPNVSELSGVDVAILCMPSRAVPSIAAALLAKGICTVDSYDIHTSIADVRCTLDAVARQNNCAAILAAGWDPGSDSVIRALLMAMVPQGITHTDFGPGMSMGHTVAAKAVGGVKDALSVTVPLGSGLHRRMVYVELESGAAFGDVEQAILTDEYFAHDETHVRQVDSVEALKDVGHGVHLTRKGASGATGNQRIDFTMTINNPALTGQILVSAARAVTRQRPGCYTMIQIAPIDFLPGDTDALIRQLV
ncbi:MAG: diaminopimelate dehydrogenase [Eubacteriales bacterium]|nr:diaminopimelate dehydrogenase [Eubacteriales bacterium]